MSDWREPNREEQFLDAYGLWEEHSRKHDCWYDFCPGRQPEPTPAAFGLRLPEEWADQVGVTVLDPDGWRIDGKDFEEPITFEDFEDRLVASTIQFRVVSDD